MTSKSLDRCTACDAHLNLKSKTTLRKHPLLKTLICSNCYRTYNGGDFSRFIDPIDENGYDNYCRWCADGGTLISCDHSECRFAFCEDCITRNFGEEYFNEITSKRWYCFVCNPLEIKELVEFAKAAFKEERPIECVQQSSSVSAEPERLNENLDESEKSTKKDEELQSANDVSANAAEVEEELLPINEKVSTTIDSLKQVNENLQQLSDDLNNVEISRGQAEITSLKADTDSKDATMNYYKEINPNASFVPYSSYETNNNNNYVTLNGRSDGYENIHKEMNSSDTCAKKSTKSTSPTSTRRILLISGVVLVASFVAYALLKRQCNGCKIMDSIKSLNPMLMSRSRFSE